MDIRDLACIGNKGRKISGTAAMLHRIFSKNPVETLEEHEEQLRQYKALIKRLGYASDVWYDLDEQDA